MLFCGITFAESSFILNENDEDVDLTNRLKSYVDNSHKLTIDDINKLQNFKPEVTPTFAFGYINANCWVKTEFEYIGTEPKGFCFAFLIPLTYNVDFYLFENGKLIKQSKNGTLLPFNQREENNRYFLFNMNLNHDKKYIFYCMAHNEQGASNFSLMLKSQKAFRNWYNKENFWLSCFYALLALIFLSSVALLISFKDKIYLLYAGYIFSILCLRTSLFGFSFKYIYPNIPEFSIMSRAIFWIFTIMFFINFSLLLVSTPKIKFPKISALFKLQTVFYIGLIVFIPINFLIFKVSQTVLSVIVVGMLINFIISLTLLLAMTITSLVKGNKPAKLYSISLFPIALICFSSILANLNLVIHPFLTNYPIEIAVIFEMIILSNALISRYKNILKDSQHLTLKLVESENAIEAHNNLSEIVSSKYQNSKYPKYIIDAKKIELYNYISENKPFLDNEMSLSKLADMSQIHSHIISQIINQKENMNFAEFINYFRIQEAKYHLTNHKLSKYSMEGLGLKCGFNSKSAFYAAFKKNTGKSPAVFQNNLNSLKIN